MADQLYLSLWYPNFRLDTLPAALCGVLRQVALISKSPRVAAASAFPLGFNESPTYQRIYVLDARAADTSDTADSVIETAVADATEQLHDDMAYEFEMRWNLWMPDLSDHASNEAQLDTLWRLEPRTLRILGFGPNFDAAAYEQNGHIRLDFGLDTPWVLDALDSDTVEEDRLDDDRDASTDPYDEADPELQHDTETIQRIQQNVEMLLALTLSIEKHCGISSRLLWTESGEPLAEKLIARLQRLQ